jgi:hypothetical protein
MEKEILGKITTYFKFHYAVMLYGTD